MTRLAGRLHITDTAIDSFGSEESFTAVNLSSATVNVLAGELEVGGYTQILNGGLTVKG